MNAAFAEEHLRIAGGRCTLLWYRIRSVCLKVETQIKGAIGFDEDREESVAYPSVYDDVNPVETYNCKR